MGLTVRYLALLSAVCVMLHQAAAECAAQAVRQVYLDNGVIRWTDSKEEVALFGANYCLPSACDYRAAGYVTKDRKALIDRDMAHFARMGWDGMRLTFWGDWENTDEEGNLVENEHLDLLDYVIAKARERNIYILLSPIVTYSSQWPDAMSAPSPGGFSTHFKKAELGTSNDAIKAQCNYLRQLLSHVNPYTKVALKEEPAILFVEMINEPWHHSNDIQGSVAYVNALVDAVRSTGCNKVLFHNLSQDFGMIEPLAQSKIEGVSFAWYPTGLVAGRTIRGNLLRTVDDYPPMRDQRFERFPKLVYEFDQPDAMSSTLYPAMTRTFRSVGAQFAAIFSYDMLATAPHNLGWQTHFINLVYTPRKVVSAIIAGEAMRRLPPYEQYGDYPDNKQFGDFRLDDENDACELLAADVFMYAGDSASTPEHPERLTRIVGFGSSPLVEYKGRGAYFLDKVRDGVWRLEVYPDAIQIRDPYERPSPDKVAVELIHRQSLIRVRLPDLSESFFARRISPAAENSTRADSGQVTVSPGIYVLTKESSVDDTSLPEQIGSVRFDEVIVPKSDSPILKVLHQPQIEHVVGEQVKIRCTVTDQHEPDQVTLFLRPVGESSFVKHPMSSIDGYDFEATVPTESLSPRHYEYCIAVRTGDLTRTFPDNILKGPEEWDFFGTEFWPLRVVESATPLVLLAPSRDFRQIDFSRIDARNSGGARRLVANQDPLNSVLEIEPPSLESGKLDDYTASLFIGDYIRSRGPSIKPAKSIRLSARAIGECRNVNVTLVDRSGRAWGTRVQLDEIRNNTAIPLADLKPTRSVMLPLAFPGRWAYWGPEPKDDDHQLEIENIERVQLSIRDIPPQEGEDKPFGIAVESLALEFETKN